MTADLYREWDAAYLVGALSLTERREYEEHLAECPECSAGLSSLVGLSGVLAVVPADEAIALLDADTPPAPTPNLLPRLVEASRRARRWARIRFAAVGAAALVAASVAVAVLVPSDPPGVSPPADQGTTVVLQPLKKPSHFSAKVRLVARPWGTRVDAWCRYQSPKPPTPTATGPRRTFDYAMYVTDREGRSTQIANWFSTAGDSEVEPSGTTLLEIGDIARIDIRSVKNGKVILQAQM